MEPYLYQATAWLGQGTIPTQCGRLDAERSWMGDPCFFSVAGWFIAWNNGTSQNKMDDNWGYPHDLGNLHVLTGLDFC